MGSGIGAFMVKSIDDFPKLQPVAIVWFVGSIMCDALITIIMVVILSRSRTGFRETDTLITKIIRSVVETGLSTTTIVILDAIFFFRLPLTNMHLCVVMIAGKTYSNSMLYTLNTRTSIRKGSSNGNTTGPHAFTTTELVFTNPQIKNGAVTRTGVNTAPTIRSRGVTVDQETVIVMDEMHSMSSRKGDNHDDELEGQYSAHHDVDSKPVYASRGSPQTVPLGTFGRD